MLHGRRLILLIHLYFQYIKSENEMLMFQNIAL